MIASVCAAPSRRSLNQARPTPTKIYTTNVKDVQVYQGTMQCLQMRLNVDIRAVMTRMSPCYAVQQTGNIVKSAPRPQNVEQAA